MNAAMSATAPSLVRVPRNSDVLGELLHSLSQPLTTLRCSLELSLGNSRELSTAKVAEQQHSSCSTALLQTEKVIGMIRLMREYLDAEHSGSEAYSTMLAPVVQSVIEDLSSIAAVHGIELRLRGSCTALLPLPEARLRLALQYLIMAKIETQPAGGTVTLRLGEGEAGTVLRVEGERVARGRDPNETNLRTTRSLTSPASTLRKVRLAIAGRVLEGAGAALVFGEVDLIGFVLRIPPAAKASLKTTQLPQH
jgi:signal transduction histidine kinase